MATGGEINEAVEQRIVRISDIAQEPLEILLPIAGYENMPLVSLEVAVEKLVHLLPSIQTYAYVAKQRCKKPANELSQDESASIMLYTMGWEPSNQCLYIVLNATLRSIDRHKLKPWFLYLRLLLNALFRLPSISRTIYRGIKLDLSNDYISGETYVWWGFSSCTIAINALQSEEFLGKTGTRTMFTIECHSAKDIRKHSVFSTEDEMLLLPAFHFEVVGCLDQGDLSIIQLKETTSPFPLLKPVPIVSHQDNPSTSGN